uniref:LID domain-containing protein n=1 Tax=Parastrongyloides trichosuri TaxID=131310 RepID=A0A0N4ZGP4_PARTI
MPSFAPPYGMGPNFGMVPPFGMSPYGMNPHGMPHHGMYPHGMPSFGGPSHQEPYERLLQRPEDYGISQSTPSIDEEEVKENVKRDVDEVASPGSESEGSMPTGMPPQGNPPHGRPHRGQHGRPHGGRPNGRPEDNGLLQSTPSINEVEVKENVKRDVDEVASPGPDNEGNMPTGMPPQGNPPHR